MNYPAFAVALLTAAPAALAQPGPAAPLIEDASVAFLGLTFIDTSTEGAYFAAREDEAQRIDLLESAIKARFEEEGMTFVDLAAVTEELGRTKNAADCNGCELRMGERLGADYVLVGEVQKVSNLILSMNLVMREPETGTMVRGQSVEIRSNTDDSWLRGMRYILKNNIFRESPE